MVYLYHVRRLNLLREAVHHVGVVDPTGSWPLPLVHPYLIWLAGDIISLGWLRDGSHNALR